MHRYSIICAACALAASLNAAHVELFVAPGGSDANPGTREKPLATPAGARDALRKIRASNGGTLPEGGAVVEFADGEYAFAEPLALDERDSGTEKSTVVWRAAHKSKAVFSGALKTRGWKVEDDPEILALLPEAARGKVIVAEIPDGIELPGFRGGGCGTPENLQEIPLSLFQGGRRLEPSRWPDAGYAPTGDNIGKIESRHDAQFCNSGRFKFDNPRLEKWSREPELWAYGLWCYEWADAKTRVLAVDPGAGTMSVDPSPIGFGIKKGAQFFVMNAVSEIDRPGEWAIDRKSRKIRLWPAGAELARLACAAGLFRCRNVSYLAFAGFTFEYSRKTAIEAEGADGLRIASCVFRHTSSWGATVRDGKDCRVEGCDMYDLGEGGIFLDGGDFRTLEPSGNVADNNHIHHFGKVVPNYRPGVQLCGVGARCTHNLIHHTVHQAIAFNGNDHYIGYNTCHDCCMFNDDAGTIYCCQRDWTKRGTVIERNIIHMTGKQPRTSGTEAIYLDDFSSGITVRGNIINRATQGIYIGGGQDCLVCGNVTMNCKTGVNVGSRGIETFGRKVSGMGRESEMFKKLEKDRALYGSPLWKSRYPNMMRVFDFPDARHAHDAHFNVVTGNVLVTSRKVELENESFVRDTCKIADNIETNADPGFEDYGNFRWNLKPGAARDLVGDLETDKIGLYDSPLRASPAVRFGEGVSAPRPLRHEYALAKVRVDLPLAAGGLPAGVAAIASECVGCDVPEWGEGRRIVTGFGSAPFDAWQEYSFSFVPAMDATLEISTMGERGEKTLYDDFRVEGAEIANGGFETDGAWSIPSLPENTSYAEMCNLEKPWGILTAAEAGVPAAEGDRMACGNDMLRMGQRMNVKKGERVKISFKARAFPIKD